ncbi:MAG: RagB/SusD family nutrient uptake outer membrane protein [Parabacteroides sp.]|nr:RagB/SusD family nutrient uptake outer membrane protein [Parabacteroides sp.]
MKKHCYIFVLIGIFGWMTSCNDNFLERSPLVNISNNDYWNSINDLSLYVNNFYNQNGLLPSYTGWGAGPYIIDASDGSDTNISTVYNRRMNGEGTLPSSGGGWSSGDWSLLRNINYFMDNYDQVNADWQDVKQYVGEALFFRSIFYFDKLRKFGDLPWASTVIGTDSDVLFSSRLPRNQIVDSMMLDLDRAVEYIPARGNGSWTGRVTKETALALQARIALYEGTWEKYHALKDTPFKVNGSDGTKYFLKAAEASGALMALAEANGYPALDNVGVEDGYWKLFNQKDYSNSKEILLWRKYTITESITNTWVRYSWSGGGRGLSKNMVESYLCKDGKPISGNPLYMGDRDLKSVVTNRDPRLNQTIQVDDGKHVIWYNPETWFTTPTFEINDGSNTSTGYQLYKGHTGDYDAYNLSSSTQGCIYFRYAETLLIYAEAKAELGTITQDDIDKTVNQLRMRVGMSNGLLDIGNITTDPNWEFPELSPLLNEIRRERKVEMAGEWSRVDDIFRWAAADVLIVGKRPLGAYKNQWLNYPGATNDFLTALNNVLINEEGYIDPYKRYATLDNGFQFNLKRDYLLPLPTNELTLNPNLKQNPGW